MALDRNKVARNAEKLVARGKLNAAIDEYRKLLAESANDTTTLNRVGDLYARLNRLDKATALFKKTADHFINEGFFVKAIAIYKKILRLDQGRIEIYEHLADQAAGAARTDVADHLVEQCAPQPEPLVA